MVGSKAKGLAVGMFAAALFAPTAVVQSAEPAGLSSLELGAWELTQRGDTGAPRRLCITNGEQLLQPNHANRQCRRYILRSSPREVSASYDCAERGQGRTDLRIETSRLIQLNAQGVFEGRPYAHALEGRHVGSCQSEALRR